MLLDENDSKTQKQLAEQVSQQAVYNRLREMGMILNNDRWVPHLLNDRQITKTHVTFCSLGTKGNRFCIVFASLFSVSQA